MPSTLKFEDDLCLDAEEYGNEARFMNSVSPTTPPHIQKNASMSTVWCRGELRIIVSAVRKIPKGQAVVLDYDEFENSYFERSSGQSTPRSVEVISSSPESRGSGSPKQSDEISHEIHDNEDKREKSPPQTSSPNKRKISSPSHPDRSPKRRKIEERESNDTDKTDNEKNNNGNHATKKNNDSISDETEDEKETEIKNLTSEKKGGKKVKENEQEDEHKENDEKEKDNNSAKTKKGNKKKVTPIKLDSEEDNSPKTKKEKGKKRKRARKTLKKNTIQATVKLIVMSLNPSLQRRPLPKSKDQPKLTKIQQKKELLEGLYRN